MFLSWIALLVINELMRVLRWRLILFLLKKRMKSSLRNGFYPRVYDVNTSRMKAILIRG